MPSEMSSNRNQLSPRHSAPTHDAPYQAVFGDVSKIIDAARESASRSVNAAMTAAYWLIGRRIVESEQSGEERGRVRGGAHRETGGGPDRTVRSRLLSSEPLQDAPLLSRIPARPDSLDTVGKIGSAPSTEDSLDAVGRIRVSIRRRSSNCLSIALVGLCAAAVCRG